MSIWIGADWQAYGTKEEIEKNLKNFKFHGMGWYQTKTDTVLILELIKVGKNVSKYIYYVWNRPDAFDDYKAVTLLPRWVIE